MELRLDRQESDAIRTSGALQVDGAFECFTLEDVIREPAGWKAGEPVASWKVPGETAIPAGRYRVTVTRSARFGRDLPLLNQVPGFAGIRIHPGNSATDTEGCILVGEIAEGEEVLQSRHAFAALFEKIEGALAAGDEVWIDVVNP